jgi:hypothetical protein
MDIREGIPVEVTYGDPKWVPSVDHTPECWGGGGEWVVGHIIQLSGKLLIGPD